MGINGNSQLANMRIWDKRVSSADVNLRKIHTQHKCASMVHVQLAQMCIWLTHDSMSIIPDTRIRPSNICFT